MKVYIDKTQLLVQLEEQVKAYEQNPQDFVQPFWSTAKDIINQMPAVSIETED